MNLQTGTKRILVIDDEEPIQEVIQGCLEELADGWQVITVGSGKAGIQLALAEYVDAILLDISMPDMDGFETFHCLQEQPQTQHIPVILLTARVQPDDRAQFASMGIAGVITKPFDPMELVEQISTTLGWS